MKAIILAGGFAKRLWPLTKETPKPLLKIGNKCVIEYIIEKIVLVPEINEIIISTNKKFEDHFKIFTNQIKSSINKNISIIADPAVSENKKLGTIGALDFVTKKLKLNEDMLIIAGDNLFEFDLRNFVDFYKKDGNAVMGVYDIKDMEKAKLFGVVKMEGERIIDLYEKPQQPVSSLISTACYLFSPKIFKLINEYSDGDNPKDAIGQFINWLVKKETVRGFKLDGLWYDIGSFEEYNYISKLYKNNV